ncbi:LOW QUALITY PROTEIN: hypothetical protein CRUP_028176 [Coryphaenoides rupestris]|nr:LOW QUALITY PROTEIN: hypothetical protein CRUP_028176 [Coryphaenoides rupestris]
MKLGGFLTDALEPLPHEVMSTARYYALVRGARDGSGGGAGGAAVAEEEEGAVGAPGAKAVRKGRRPWQRRPICRPPMRKAKAGALPPTAGGAVKRALGKTSREGPAARSLARDQGARERWRDEEEEEERGRGLRTQEETQQSGGGGGLYLLSPVAARLGGAGSDARGLPSCRGGLRLRLAVSWGILRAVSGWAGPGGGSLAATPSWGGAEDAPPTPAALALPSVPPTAAAPPAASGPVLKRTARLSPKKE